MFTFNNDDSIIQVFIKAFDAFKQSENVSFKESDISTISLVERDSENKTAKVNIVFAATGLSVDVSVNLIDSIVFKAKNKDLFEFYKKVEDMLDENFELKSDYTSDDFIGNILEHVPDSALNLLAVGPDDDEIKANLSDYFSYTLDKENFKVIFKHESCIFTDIVVDLNRGDYVIKNKKLSGFKTEQLVNVS